ncbi:MAG: LysR substrate-binding domain-containing protein [Acidimicrobiales bacterium]
MTAAAFASQLWPSCWWGQADRIIDALDMAESHVHAGRTEVAGRFTIAAFPSSARFVASTVHQLWRSHPRLDVRTVELEPDDALTAVGRGDVDLAVAHDYRHDPHPSDASLDRRTLFEEPLAVFEQATSPRAALAEFADCAFAAPSEQNACGRAVRTACRAAGFEPQVTHVSNDFNVLLAHVEAGSAVALLPASALGHHRVAVTPLPDHLE